MGAACSTQNGRGEISHPHPVTDVNSTSNSDDALSKKHVETHAPPAKYQKHRRGSVSAEVSAMTMTMPKGFKPKSAEARSRIKAALQHSFVFKGLDEEQEQAIISSMFERNASASETIIREGEEGDNCYVIESGTYAALKDDKQVYLYDGHGAFGELALLYNCPRAASVQAITNGVLWGVDRATFRKIMVASTAARRARFENTLKDIPLFSGLSAEQRALIADCLEAENFEIGDYVLQEGDAIGTDAKFYLVESGIVRCMKTYEGSVQPVADVKAGGFFGELGLVTSAPRAADCIADSDKVRLLSMGREAFQRLMGPVDGVLAEKVREYADFNLHKQSPASTEKS